MKLNDKSIIFMYVLCKLFSGIFISHRQYIGKINPIKMGLMYESHIWKLQTKPLLCLLAFYDSIAYYLQ
jgi:hypothetical protein